MSLCQVTILGGNFRECCLGEVRSEDRASKAAKSERA
jgi:hypothetical protein